MHPVETYLRDLRSSHTHGVAETSGYGALATLLNEIGASLKPNVVCIIHPKSQGAGIPDSGLFTHDQLPKDGSPPPLHDLLPARGVVEVKSSKEEVQQIATSEQVEKYLFRYGHVLVTNYRAFLLVVRDQHGLRSLHEAYSLADSDQALWATPIKQIVDAHAEGLSDYLKRIMLHNVPMTNPQDLAWMLASYARDARRRIGQADLPTLAPIRSALEESLGITFEGNEGDSFFRSTLVQTLFYGLFAAWVLWHTEQPERTDTFRWKESAYYLHVPILQFLFEQISQPTKLKPLHLVEVLDWTGAVLNRVDRVSFFATFEAGQAVQYFYEPFLEAFDADLRKRLGVWYTPPEVVRYMVARVDRVLREELDVANGLANPDVYVLDPCCGTGTYLVEVLRSIADTLRQQGEGAVVGEEVKQAIQERVFGFELMPAPFVIAHLQLGVLLQQLGVSLGEDDRVGVYLTNALTGWLPPDETEEQATQLALMGMPELQEERKKTGYIKRDVPIMVILGNPPYNAYAGVSPKDEEGLVAPYKAGLSTTWSIKKYNLDDLYIRFFRLAERRIAEMSGRGIVCYISNHSWVSEPSFVVARQHLLNSFNRFWVENMHGNRKISEYAPDGRTSESIFAIRGFSGGIQQGVVISLWLKNDKQHTNKVLFRDDINAAKAEERRAQLLASLQIRDFDAQYTSVNPTSDNRYSFRPMNVSAQYLTWPKLVDLCAEAPINGLMEKRGGALIDIDRKALEQHMKMYYDPHVSWEELTTLRTGLTGNAARFDAKQTRAKVLATESYQQERLRRYAVRPFDNRWCYYSATRPLWNEPRPRLWAQCWHGNAFLMSRPAGVSSPEGVPIGYTTLLGDNDYQRGHAYYFPLRLQKHATETATAVTATSSDNEHAPIIANLAPLAREYLAKLGITNPDEDAETATLLWMHALAIGYSPRYLSENADGIRQDWPRIPLPLDREVLLHSAALGQQVAALLDTEQPVDGVTAGHMRPELKYIGVLKRADGGSINRTAGDLDVRAGWGYAGRGGMIMPGKGQVQQRAYTPDEQAAIGDVTVVLGEVTCDIFINDMVYWCNIPQRVWEYTIGGYQAIKKWLSYREYAVLGRALSLDEAREMRDMARRLAALVLLEPALDAHYANVT